MFEVVLTDIFPVYIIFIFIVAIILTIFIFAFIKALKRKKIFNQGKKKIAKLIGIFNAPIHHATHSNQDIELVKMFGLEYQFMSDSGEIIRRRSEETFPENQIKLFQEAEYFEVIVQGTEAIIFSVPSTKDIARFSEMKNSKTCSYCGSRTKKENGKCPNCGATVFEDILKK